MKLTDVRSTALGLSVAALLAGSAAVAQAQETFITIGTGGQTGVYYQVGGAVCRLVNRNTAEHHIKYTHTTGGSVDNINGIRKIGRAHVCTPVTNAHLVCRLLLEQKN